MSSRNSSPRRMNLSPDVRGRPARPHIPTEDEIRAMFGPARTLGAPEDACIAMDNRLASSGVYTLLQHTFETGMAPAAQFMGYGALQNIPERTHPCLHRNRGRRHDPRMDRAETGRCRPPHG